jgi:uncharacterized protein (DUF2062 family)
MGKTMPNYEPQRTEEFADKLCKQAKAVIWQTVVAGLFLGGFLGLVIGVGIGLVQVALVEERTLTGGGQVISTFAVVGGLLLSVLGGMTGYHSGKARSSELRSKARRALYEPQSEKDAQQ